MCNFCQISNDKTETVYKNSCKRFDLEIEHKFFFQFVARIIVVLIQDTLAAFFHIFGNSSTLLSLNIC